MSKKIIGKEMENIKGQSKLISNYYSIKKYTDDYFKLTFHKKPIKNSGFETDSNTQQIRDKNDNKLDCSISRTKSKIFEYAACNDFDYFVTLTLDKKKKNRDDLESYIKKLGQFIRDQRKKHNTDIQYLLIPEQHKDGSWHFHGLFKGNISEQLRLFTLSEKLPYKLRELISAGEQIYDWTDYREIFGYTTLQPIKNSLAVSKYITKYITKALDEDFSIIAKNKKLYYQSRGLKQALKIKEGTLSATEVIPFDYSNDYVSVKYMSLEEYSKFLAHLL